ncbi:MAG: hypothetical protein J5722_01075, partial [Oscillospiraceae bacterium]|nr:hypothetical protein [Oscillospiraceae bacterium]
MSVPNNTSAETVYLKDGNATVESGCELGNVRIKSGQLDINGGYLSEISLAEDHRDFTATMAKQGATVQTIPSGYEWKDGGSYYVLGTVYNPVTVNNLGVTFEYNNWTERDIFRAFLYDEEGHYVSSGWANMSNQTAYFKPVEYLLPGIYEYNIKQVVYEEEQNFNVEYDLNTYGMTVEVTEGA